MIFFFIEWFFMLKAFLKYLWVKLTGREVIVTGKCLKCGDCCRSLRLCFGGRWLKDEADFERLRMGRPELARLSLVRRHENGCLEFRCEWLMEDGTCKDHEHRMEICKDYPDEGRFYRGAPVNDTCGFRVVARRPFKKVLDNEMKKLDKKGPKHGK